MAKDGVHIFSYQPGQDLPSEADISFPAVPTADGCVWSADGNLLGLVSLKTGGVVVYRPDDGYEKYSEVPPLIQGSVVRMFYFSPLGNHLVTYERWLKDAGDNIGLWDAKTGELRWSFTMKTLTEMNWPPLKWTSLETHCCRMVSDGVQILKGIAARDEPLGKIDAPNILAFEVAPRGAGSGPPHVAVVVPEAKGAPARCLIYSVDDPSKIRAGKSFYKVQKAVMKWNNTGSSLLVLTSMETDDTGKAYYGSTNLYFMRADGSEDCIVASAGDGAVHDVEWSPMQDEFLLMHGDLPCKMNLHDGKKATQKMEFGSGHRNTIRWNQFGRFVLLGGYGQLAGDVDFWDKTGRKKLGSVRMECIVHTSWAPDGRHFMGATTAPRMRVDNKIEIFDYCGNKLGSMPFPDAELSMASWRPRPRGMFEDRPPSPGRQAPSAAKAGGPKAAAKQAYRPPGARSAGGSGLSAMLRQELGSTSAAGSSTANKTFGRVQHALPPGMAPPSQDDQGGGPSRNARKKKGKEAAAAAAEKEREEKLAAALSHTEFSPPPRKEKEKEAEPAENEPPRAVASSRKEGEGGGAADNPDVERKVKALRKKLRDIEKLKEKPTKDLDVLQKEKLKGEADLLKQLRELGVEE